MEYLRAKVPEDKPLNQFNFIDLFAGIGAFHYALSDLGATCVFASEIDQPASLTYTQNHHIKPAGDITQIAANDIPSHDILCAGFPCQAFSVSGKRLGFEDTRGTLFFDIARIAKHHQPSILFLENVKNLVGHDQGKTLARIIEVLKALNYEVHYKVLNTSHFGLPQNRERVYIVATHQDKCSVDFKFPEPINSEIALHQILEDQSEMPSIVRSDMVFTKQPESVQEVSNVPNRPVQIGIVNKGGQGERIYHPVGHAITLSAHGGGVGSKTGLYWIDGKLRKLSPRECARLHGFPEDFKIHPSKNQAYKQFGNSASIPVLKAIASQFA